MAGFCRACVESLNPKFTAEKIFEIESKEPLVVVKELGFANISMGLLGIVTIFNSVWIVPSAIVSGLFYRLAGAKHLARKGRNFTEDVATLLRRVNIPDFARC